MTGSTFSTFLKMVYKKKESQSSFVLVAYILAKSVKKL